MTTILDNMPPCQFVFDMADSKVFDGFAFHNTRWNGFDNVAVTPAVRDAIVAFFAAEFPGEDTDESNRDMLAIPPLENGLISMANGYATSIVKVEVSTADEMAREFPDFPLADLPANIPAWLICAAWHNDSCPIWGDESYVAGNGGIGLAIEYLDPAMRDELMEDLPRFSCWETDGVEQIGESFLTDDWAEMLAHLEAMRTAR